MSRPYQNNERILARNENSSIYYEAKVINNDTTKDGKRGFLVHYKGWHKRHDEVILDEEVNDRTQAFTDEAFQKAKEAELEAKKGSSKQKPRKARSVEGGNDSKSRDSSPPSNLNEEDGKAESDPSIKNSKTRPSKRKHEESGEKETSGRKSELNLVLPNPLKKILVEDHDLINRQMKLYNLPAKVTVTKIIDDYITTLTQGRPVDGEVAIAYDGGRQDKHQLVEIIQSCKGVRDYFEKLLPVQLLYKFERPQYEEFSARKEANQPQNKKKRSTSTQKEETKESSYPFSDAYGFPHLLRLLSRFETYLKQTVYPERIRHVIVNSVCDFVVFLNKNQQKYFSTEDYQVGKPDYQREAFI